MKCPKCGCPFISCNRFTTAEGYGAWKDKDGKWYSGPASDVRRYTCQGCYYTYTETYSRGKKVEKSADVLKKTEVSNEEKK